MVGMMFDMMIGMMADRDRRGWVGLDGARLISKW